MLIVATHNEKKRRELAALLAQAGLEVKSLRDCPQAPAEIPETGETFLENARLKAHAVARSCGAWALADDSGLEVDALGGAPGVRSARFAGEGAGDEANNRLLLELLKGVEDERRTARFVCVIVLASPDGEEWWWEGTCPGRIVREPRGAGGFGYDPLFVPDGFQQTFAEMPPEQKNRISHRARALAAAVPDIAALLQRRAQPQR